MKKILEYAGLIYAMLVFVGYINLHSYYGMFGIEIWTYLDSGELLLSFLPLTVPLLIFGAGVVILQLTASEKGQGIVYRAYHAIVDQKQPIPTVTAKVEWNWKKMKWWQIVMLLLLGGVVWIVGGAIGLGIMYAVVLMVIKAFAGIDAFSGSWWIDALYLFVVVFFVSYTLKRARTEHRTTWLATSAVGFFIMALLYLAGINGTAAKKVMRGHGVQQALIVTDDGYYRTDTTLVYVGKCNSTVFLYDRRSLSNVAIPTDHIKTMTVFNPRFEEWAEPKRTVNQRLERFYEGVPSAK